MSEIFISYASPDRDTARQLAARLEAKGHHVWWDRNIPPGRVFDDVIQEALNAAGCVVVLWSPHSVVSNWVRVEAEEASARGLLVPVFIDKVTPPMQFKRIQAANLTGWDGDDSHPEFQSLVSSIDRLLGRPAAAVGPRRAAWTWNTRNRWLVAVGGGVLIVALVAAILALRGGSDTGATPASANQQTSTASGPATGAPSTPSPSASSANSVPRPVRRGDLINLLAPENGGELVAAQDAQWAATVDGDENSQLWVTFYSGGTSEAVFAFKDEQFATVEGIEILVPGASPNNVGEFELLTGTESPTGRFDSVGTFKTRNMLIVKERYQRFMFPARTARYVKARVLKSHAPSMSTGLNEWRLLGTLN